MRSPRSEVTTGWGGVQRRVRRLVPAPIRRADLALFRAVARADVPVLGPLLPPLSRAANHSRLWLAIAAGLTWFGGRFGRRAGLRGVLAIGATSALTNLPAKLLAGRTRPELDLVPEVRRLARVPASTSFPSGHAASAFAFASAVAMEQPRLRVPIAGVASAVAFSRVYTGVHYPGDVLAGAAIGVAVARATTRVWPLADDTPATGAAAGLDVPAGDEDGAGVVVVANADAGTALGADPLRRLRTELPGASFVEAESGEDLPHLLHRAARTARVLAVAGGDGSASAGAEAAADAGVPLLVVPGGTLNHLAGDLGLGSVEDAIRAVRAGRAVRADLGVVDGHGFVNAASIGTYPHLVAARERLEARIGKWPAALWALVRVLVTHDPFELEIDGRRRRVWFLFFGNGRFRDDGLAPTRRQRLDEGLLDIRLIDADVPLARTRIVLSLLTGRVGRSAAYERWFAEQVQVRSLDGPLQLAGDGETWQGPQEVTVRKRRGALLLLQP
jgi:diacylglycerol kinase family enzyme/membrane-associated phospholipid phosphatase